MTHEKYNECVAFMRMLPLDALHSEFAGVDEAVQVILKQYAALCSPSSPGWVPEAAAMILALCCPSRRSLAVTFAISKPR